MLNYKLLISYDGTAYSGWQGRINDKSIQALIETALTTVLREPITIIGSGRTDSGVHALAQVAHFTTTQNFNTKKILHSLNCLLSSDIRIHSLEQTDTSFHARYSAQGKIYRYHILECYKYDPFKRHTAYCLPYPIDHALLAQAARYFIGTKDFTSFSNEPNQGSCSRNPIRTIKRLDIHIEGGEIILEFEGNGFLYKMVRNIVGTLLDIARGKIPLENLPKIFEAKDRRQAGRCAPPQGLFLVKVIYV